MKNFVVTMLLFLAFSFCGYANSINVDERDNWLIGKWEVDYSRMAMTPIGKKSIKLVRKLFGNNMIEWNSYQLIAPNGVFIYSIREFSPKKITFEYKNGVNIAKETWQRDGVNIFYSKPNFIIYLKKK
jgi:hypothetical protein